MDRPTSGNLWRLAFVLAVCLAGLLAPSSAPAASDTEDAKLAITADKYAADQQRQVAVADGDVRITLGDMRLRADHVEIDLVTQQFSATGNIAFERGMVAWRGDALSGNFAQNNYEFGVYQAVVGVWYVKGDGGGYDSNSRFYLDRAQLSTCDYLSKPHYSVDPKRVVFRPDGTYTAHHTIVKLGRVPILYLPVIHGSTDAEGGALEIKPGYDSDWGPYLLLGREWRVNPNLRTKVMIEERANKGPALGNRTILTTEKSASEVFLYGMDDHDPPETGGGFNRRFDPVEDRYRANVEHRQEVTDELSLRLKLDAYSDIDMLEDWFRRIYRNDPQPKTLVNIANVGERYVLSLGARGRVNDFLTVTESLPELRLDMPRQQILQTGLFYEGKNQLSHLEMRWRDFDQPRTTALGAVLADPADYGTWRFDSVHMVHLPIRLGSVAQIVSRGGMRLTYYENSSDAGLTDAQLYSLFEVDDTDAPYSSTAITNYDHRGGSRLRFAAEGGVELRTKLYRSWPSFQKPEWGLNGLRHIVEPYANYTYISEPTQDRKKLFFFDEVDRLNRQHFVRIGFDQRFQTRRSRKIYTVAEVRSYADLHFDKETGQHHAGNLGADLDLRPTDRLGFRAVVVSNVGEPSLNRGEASVTVGPEDGQRFTLGYIYRDDYVSRTVHSMGSHLLDLSGENNLLARPFRESHYVTGSFRFPLGSKMWGRVACEYDMVEDEVALQSYGVSRELHCWQGAVRVEEENGEWRLVTVFYLTAFPRVRLDASL